MGTVHKNVRQQLEKKNKNSKVKKFASFLILHFKDKKTIRNQVKYPKKMQLPTLL